MIRPAVGIAAILFLPLFACGFYDNYETQRDPEAVELYARATLGFQCDASSCLMISEDHPSKAVGAIFKLPNGPTSLPTGSYQKINESQRRRLAARFWIKDSSIAKIAAAGILARAVPMERLRVALGETSEEIGSKVSARSRGFGDWALVIGGVVLGYGAGYLISDVFFGLEPTSPDVLDYLKSNMAKPETLGFAFSNALANTEWLVTRNIASNSLRHDCLVFAKYHPSEYLKTIEPKACSITDVQMLMGRAQAEMRSTREINDGSSEREIYASIACAQRTAEDIYQEERRKLSKSASGSWALPFFSLLISLCISTLAIIYLVEKFPWVMRIFTKSFRSSKNRPKT
jgi:hypothetical protein